MNRTRLYNRKERNNIIIRKNHEEIKNNTPISAKTPTSKQAT